MRRSDLDKLAKHLILSGDTAGLKELVLHLTSNSADKTKAKITG